VVLTKKNGSLQAIQFGPLKNLALRPVAMKVVVLKEKLVDGNADCFLSKAILLQSIPNLLTKTKIHAT
jgi:hypothetical protein